MMNMKSVPRPKSQQAKKQLRQNQRPTYNGTN